MKLLNDIVLFWILRVVERLFVDEKLGEREGNSIDICITER